MLRYLIAVLLLGLCCTPVSGAVDDDYRLGDGDILKVTVYGHADLTLTSRVGSDGTILFPLIGQVAIGGLTAPAAGEKIAAALADGYLVNPQVSVFIEQFRNRQVVFMGEILRPGLYDLPGPTSLLELISQAGGLSREAGSFATIHRKAEGGAAEEMIQVDLKKLMEEGVRDQDQVLRDGDNVYIARAGLVYVTGHVKNPNSYASESDSTVLMMVTKAGGFTKLAAKGRIKVVRKTAEGEEIFERVPLSMTVQPDDVIVVPESYF
jgi:polysaccharide export outer membrane protein